MTGQEDDDGDDDDDDIITIYVLGTVLSFNLIRSIFITPSEAQALVIRFPDVGTQTQGRLSLLCEISQLVSDRVGTVWWQS